MIGDLIKLKNKQDIIKLLFKIDISYNFIAYNYFKEDCEDWLALQEIGFPNLDKLVSQTIGVENISDLKKRISTFYFKKIIPDKYIILYNLQKQVLTVKNSKFLFRKRKTNSYDPIIKNIMIKILYYPKLILSNTRNG